MGSAEEISVRRKDLLWCRQVKCSSVSVGGGRENIEVPDGCHLGVSYKKLTH